MSLLNMSHQERGDIIFNFIYLIGYGATATAERFAQVIEENNASPQAKALIEYLRGCEGTVSLSTYGTLTIDLVIKA